VSGHYHGDVSQVPSAIAATLGLEGLRERKKRQMRQLISDTATEMFLERGFDDVRVTEVAERCGVSEKTVYNYFPTKESLLLDREQAMTVALRAAFGPGAPARSPTQAALEVLKGELELLRPNWDALHVGEPRFERFADLVENTPSLRAAQRDLMDRLVQVVAEAMADRAGVSPDDPEPQIAAAAILGLWRIQYQALRLYSGGSRGFEQVYEEVTSEVARAARLIDSGLWAFEVMVQGRGTQEQMRAAAEAAQMRAGRWQWPYARPGTCGARSRSSIARATPGTGRAKLNPTASATRDRAMILAAAGPAKGRVAPCDTRSRSGSSPSGN
jgi:AcrR family transcriptional regulator